MRELGRCWASSIGLKLYGRTNSYQVGRMLDRLDEKGLVVWRGEPSFSGWELTAAGREEIGHDRAR